MFRWRQQRIHREFGQEHWQPGTRRAWSANEEITSSHPIPVTGQSLARKRGDKMVLGSMMSDNLCSSFSTPGCSYITFQERQKLQIFCPLWKGCLNVTLELMCSTEIIRTYFTLCPPFLASAAPALCLSDFFWQIVSPEPRPVSWEESALAHCLEDEELPGGVRGNLWEEREIIPFHFVPAVIPGTG